MHLLPWRMPKIIEGAHSVEKLPNFIKELNYKKILIVSDKTLVSLGLLNTLLQSLDKENIEYILFTPEGIVMLSMFSQPENTYSPILVTLSGMTIFVKLVHHPNA